MTTFVSKDHHVVSKIQHFFKHSTQDSGVLWSTSVGVFYSFFLNSSKDYHYQGIIKHVFLLVLEPDVFKSHLLY